MNQLLHYIRGVVPAQQAAKLPDRELLRRFATERDEVAFAALVARYGGSVWAVCRRLVDREHDAEDAFQATFLTLARKAGSIRDEGSLPAWLHEVARRIAANLRRDARRHADTEAKAAQRPRGAAAELSWQEGLAVLDEELARLPERYRAVLIVCCLDGRTRDEAAAHLGWSLGQVKGRLERARQLMRRRLQRRGFDFAAMTLAAAVSGWAAVARDTAAAAAVAAGAGAPAGLVEATVGAAISFAAGGAATSGLVSSRVVLLAAGVLKAMFIQKIKTLTAVFLALALCGGGALTYGVLAAAGADNGKQGRDAPIQALGQGDASVEETDKEDGTKAAEAAQTDEEREAAKREAEARAREERARAEREAAAQAGRAKETPTGRTPPIAADIKVDFEDVVVSINPAAAFAARMPEEIRIRGDGVCEYSVEERPARGTEPAWNGARLNHKLALERLRCLEGLLKKTEWLTAAGFERGVPQLHPTKYVLSLKRKGATRTIDIVGDAREPYKSLLAFLHGIADQEHLFYRLERTTPKERWNACRDIDRYVRAERGDPNGKPVFEIDLRRYVPPFQRYVRYPFQHDQEELPPALRLLAHFRLESEREHIAALAGDRDSHVRGAVAEALGALGGKESVPVLGRMIRSTSEASWELIKLGPIAVPTIVEAIESGKDPFDEGQPEFLDYQKVIRAYLDHWDEVAKPIDPRVLEAVRKSMAAPKIKAYGTEYHRKLLELASP